MKTGSEQIFIALCRRLVLPLLLLLGFSPANAQHLVINEFSQGNSGAREYIELVVVGTRTCAGDSCADIRGWIVDDNNGWCGAGAGQGIATGHMRFSNDPNWSCVPYGSIILLYNSGDVNPSITLADDPTDANNDNVYVVPSTSTLLENTTATPVSPSSATYVYPAVAYASGGNWSTVGLANGGDAVIITSPANLGVAAHSIAYGSVTGGGTATIYKNLSGAAKVYYLNDGQYTVAASYLVGDAPNDESPGVANSPANAAWIAAMLAPPGGAVSTSLAACINPGDSYNFNGTTLTTGGVFYDTLSTTSGCDSIVQLTLTLVTPQSSFGTITSCNFVVFNGNTYTSSTIVNDTLWTIQGCDSVYRQTVISITNVVPLVQRDTVSGCQSIVFKGIPYTTSQEVADTLRTPTGCDSIYRLTYLNVVPNPLITVTPIDPTVCRGTEITLTASSSSTVQWIGYPAGPSITVTPQITTSYSVEASNELNCVSVAYTTVYVEDFNMALDYSPRPAEKGSVITLNASANMGYTVLGWEPAALFGNPTSSSQQMTADQSMYVTVVGRNDKGCTDTAKVYVEVLPVPHTFLPTAFSPNGDGLNDYFGPVFIREYHVKVFSIFNRWGQRVYQASGNSQLGQGWDGRYNGTACDAGTYYYLLQAEAPGGKVQEFKGDVSLVR